MLLPSIIFGLLITGLVLAAMQNRAEPSELKILGAILPPFIAIAVAAIDDRSAISGDLGDLQTDIAWMISPILALVGFALGAAMAKRSRSDDDAEDS